MIYLASPYTHQDKKIMESRFNDAVSACAFIMQKGFIVYSPIVHMHPIAIAHDLPRDWEYWKKVDSEMVTRCDSFWILTLDGWKQSLGIANELQIAKNKYIPCFLASITDKINLEPIP